MLYTLFLFFQHYLSSIGNQKKADPYPKRDAHSFRPETIINRQEGKFGWLFSLFTYIALFLRATQAFRSSDLLGGMNVYRHGYSINLRHKNHLIYIV